MSTNIKCAKNKITSNNNNNKSEINIIKTENNCTFNNNNNLIPNKYKEKNIFEKLKELQKLFQKYSFSKELCI